MYDNPRLYMHPEIYGISSSIENLPKKLDRGGIPVEHIGLGYIYQALSIQDGQRLCGLIPGRQAVFPAFSWDFLVSSFSLYDFSEDIPVPFAKTVPTNNANYSYTRTIIASETDKYDNLNIPDSFDVSGKNVVIKSNVQEKKTHTRKFGPWSTELVYISSVKTSNPTYLSIKSHDDRKEQFIMEVQFEGDRNSYRSQFTTVNLSTPQYFFEGKFDHSGAVISSISMRK